MNNIVEDLRKIRGIQAAIGASDEIAEMYRDACCAFVRTHGPALLARQEGEDRLRDLHHAIRLVYGCVPNLPIDESTMDAATDALHNFCLMVGIHEVDVDSPIDDAARSGGGGSVVKFSDTDGCHYEIHHDPIP